MFGIFERHVKVSHSDFSYPTGEIVSNELLVTTVFKRRYIIYGIFANLALVDQ